MGGPELCDQFTELVLEAEAEHGPVFVLDIGIVEGEERAVAADTGERAYRLVMKQDIEN